MTRTWKEIALGARLDTEEGIRGLVEELEEMIGKFRMELVELEKVSNDLDDRIQRNRRAMNEMLALRSGLMRSFPDVTEMPLESGATPWLGGVSIGEAIEWIMRAEAREMTQDELVEVLEAAGFPLGDHPGRKIHAATMKNRRIHKTSPGIYLYAPEPAEEFA